MAQPDAKFITYVLCNSKQESQSEAGKRIYQDGFEPYVCEGHVCHVYTGSTKMLKNEASRKAEFMEAATDLFDNPLQF